jgi:hypothetical protein
MLLESAGSLRATRGGARPCCSHDARPAKLPTRVPAPLGCVHTARPHASAHVHMNLRAYDLTAAATAGAAALGTALLGPDAAPAALDGQPEVCKFSKVLYFVALYSIYTRSMTLQNF